MAFREIDDRYPEFARPYEPVGRSKRRKGLGWGFASGLVLILAAALSVPALIPTPQPAPTPAPPIVVPEPEPEPEPEPAPEPKPEIPIIVEPTVEPAEVVPASVSPEPAVTPTPAPAPAPTPPPAPAPAVPQYTVTFLDWDGTVLRSASYDEGTAASSIAQPAAPTRPRDDSYTYTFAGWSPELADVTADATYTATYTSAPIVWYTVTFVDYDGVTVLQAATSYAEGTPAAEIVQPATPTRPSDAENTYTFSGWSPALADVTADAVYTAVYDSAKQKYTITWQNYDGSVIDTTQVEVGETPVHADPTYGPTPQYTYTFTGWSPAIAPVTGDATYTANYTVEDRMYYVTFADWDGTVILPAAPYPFGALSSIVIPPDPTRPSDASYSYTFAGWSPEITNVHEDVTYTATYTATPLTYSAPDISSLSSVTYSGSSSDRVGTFTPSVTLNDVAVSGATGMLRLMQQNPSTGEWEQREFGGSNSAQVSLTTSGTGGSDVPFSPSDPNAQYELPAGATSLDASVDWHFPYSGYQAERDVMKLAFDYTFPNGETGTVETDQFYLYNGNFVFAGEPVLDRDAKTITMDFSYSLDIGGPIDQSKAFWTEHHLYWQDKASYDPAATGTELSLTPTLSEYDATDGTHHVQVVYTLDEIDDRVFSYEADVTYSDYGDPSHWNNWDVMTGAYQMEFPPAASTHTAPGAPSVASSVSSGGTSEDYNAAFMLQAYPLNDAQNARIAIRLQRWDEGSSSWVDPNFVPESASTPIYDAQTIYGVQAGTVDDPDDPWSWSETVDLDVGNPTQLFDVGDHNIVSVICRYHFPSGWWDGGMRVLIRPVMDVEYSDGETETIEGRPFYVFAGTYVHPNLDFGDTIEYDGVVEHLGYTSDAATRTLTMDYIYDTEVEGFDPANVNWSHNLRWTELLNPSNYGYVSADPTVSTYVGTDGKTHAQVTYVLDEGDYHEGLFRYQYRGWVYYQDETSEYSGLWENSAENDMSFNH